MRYLRRILPPELIDAFIDASAKDRDTLKAFAVVSRSCLPRCRHYLFQSIVFSTDHGEAALAERHQNFRAIMDRDPGIKSYVQKLVVQDLEQDNQPLTWMITNSLFHKSLELLAPSLKRFTFVADSYDWTTFPSSLKLAFMAIFLSPTLKFLRLQNLEGIPSTCCVAFGTQIADLSLISSSFRDTLDPDLPIVQSNGTPQNLYWLGLEDVDEGSIGVLLDAWVPVPSTGQERPLFPCLTALNVGPTDEDSLGPLQQLFAINYEVTFYPDDDIAEIPDPPDQFDGLIALLRTVTPGTIQQLNIKVNFQDYTNAIDSLKGYDGWSTLDALLNSDLFDYLLDTTFQIYLEAGFDNDEMNVDETLEERKVELEALLKSRLPFILYVETFTFIFMVGRRVIY
ncbi:hypothetical protein H0H87_008793 [Tephrocybe sp. NHM501043]|nr:hypothetical protein H0H87_008793 [Tephrocybe sp. NHM501043]